MTVFSERLKAAREIRKISQTELCRTTGIDLSQFCHFEKGNRKPSMDNLKKICEGLDVSADYLLGIAEYPFVTQQTVVNDFMAALSNRDFDTIMNLLRFFNKTYEDDNLKERGL